MNFASTQDDLVQNNQDIFHEAPIAYYEIDNTGTIVRVNKAAELLLGIPASSSVGRKVFEFVLDDQQETALKRAKDRMEGRAAMEPYEAFVRHKSGALLLVEMHQSLIRDRASHVTGIRSAMIDLTARRKAEEQLHVTEAMYRAVIEGALDALFVADKSARITSFNPAAEVMFGYKSDQVIGKLVPEVLIPPELVWRFQETFQRNTLNAQNLATGGERFECIFKRSDETRFPAETSLTWLKLGGQLQLAAFVRDITNRVRLERERQHTIQKLSTQRDRTNQILRKIAGGILVMDVRGRVLFGNDWIQRFLKIPLPSPKSIGVNDILTGWFRMDGSAYRAADWPHYRSLRDGEDVLGEDVTYNLDGQVCITLNINSQAIRGKRGRVIAAVTTFTDITARRNAENALVITDRRYRQMFDEDVSTNFILNDSMDLIGFNQAALRVFGFRSREELFDAWFRKDYPVEKDRKAILSLLTRSEHQPSELRLHRKDSSVALLIGTLSGVSDQNGSLKEIRGRFLDVTERRRTERKISNLYARLMKVQNQERQTLSRDLHDSTGQNLSALAMNLTRIEGFISSDVEGARAAIAESRELVQSCIRDIRTVSYSLFPPLLEDLGLSPALQWFVEGFTQRSEIDVSLDISPDLGRMGRHMETTLFRIAQEALTNVHRHSGSKNAHIRVSRRGKKVTLQISDEGTGASNPRDGIGLASIWEQTAAIGGKLKIESDRGFAVTITASIKD